VQARGGLNVQRSQDQAHSASGPCRSAVRAAGGAVGRSAGASGQSGQGEHPRLAKIKFEAPLGGFLTEINGKYKLRITELTLAPGGHVGEHNHVGPGIRQVASGYMTYVLPKETIVYGPGDFFFETGDINHTVYNKTDAPMVHILFEILPAALSGPSLIPVKHH
jgi:quercetin dioxygenase-like cupin family protein